MCAVLMTVGVCGCEMSIVCRIMSVNFLCSATSLACTPVFFIVACCARASLYMFASLWRWSYISAISGRCFNLIA